MNIGEEEYTKVVEDGILTIKGRLLVDIEADLQNAYNEGYEQGKKDASGNIIRCKDCRFWERLMLLAADEPDAWKMSEIHLDY